MFFYFFIFIVLNRRRRKVDRVLPYCEHKSRTIWVVIYLFNSIAGDRKLNIWIGHDLFANYLVRRLRQVFFFFFFRRWIPEIYEDTIAANGREDSIGNMSAHLSVPGRWIHKLALHHHPERRPQPDRQFDFNDYRDYYNITVKWSILDCYLFIERRITMGKKHLVRRRRTVNHHVPSAPDLPVVWLAVYCVLFYRYGCVVMKPRFVLVRFDDRKPTDIRWVEFFE